MASRLGPMLVVAMLLSAVPVGIAILTSSHSQPTQFLQDSGTTSGQSNHYSYSDLIYLINHRGNGSYLAPGSMPTHAGSSFSGISTSYSSASGTSNSVVFSESGLPSNSTWFVTTGGKEYSTNGTSQTISLSPGSYSYSIGTDLNYISREPSGTFILPGPDLSISTTFQSALLVKSTLFIDNGTFLNGNHLISNSASAPIGILDNPLNNYTYVADSAKNVVGVIDSSGQVIGGINTGTSPSQIAFDSSNGYMYVSNSGSNTISVVNKNNSVVGTIGVGNFPFGLAYDPANNYLYVANIFSNSITILSPSQTGTASTVATIHLSSTFNPFFAVYDKSTGSVFVSNVNGNQIAVIDGTTNTGYVTVMGSPAMMAYDSSNGNLYVADAQTSASTGDGYLSIINSKGTVTANYIIPGSANPFGVSYDKNRNVLYVSDANSNQVSVFNPVNNQFINRIQVGSEPYGVSINPVTNMVEITNFNSGSISYLGSLGAVKSVTFKESGLAPGTSWSTRLGNYSITSHTGEIVFNETPGTYSYTPAGVAGYLLSSGPSSVSVSGQNIVVNIAYEKLYNVSVRETGLPGSTPWSFTLNGQNYTSTSSKLDLSLTNGSYSIVPGQVSGFFAPPGKVMNVTGADTSVKLNYRQSHPVTFTEKGLAHGQKWSIDLNGTIHTSFSDRITAELPNGTYEYSVSSIHGYSISSVTGSVTVQGSASYVSISYVRLYNVTFVEHGLYSGSNWSATLGNSLVSTLSGNITFNVPNGTYAYNISAPSGYIPPFSTGSVSVSGNNAVINVYFTRNFQVAFIESGLPQGKSWWLNVDNMNITTTADEIGLNLTNGTYSYAASSILGYVLAQGSGQIYVNGGSVVVYLNYSKLYPVTFAETGLPSGTSWYLNITGLPSIQSRTSGITTLLTNGTYSYTIATSNKMYRAPGGTLTVGGSSKTVSIGFSPVKYQVSFTETGLPSGTTWYVNLSDGISLSSSSPVITAFLTNGSYSYGIATLDKVYRSRGGAFTVAGAPLSEAVSFTPVKYTVTFTETGLPSGVSWFINMTGGQSYSSTGAQISVSLTNGSYQYTVSTSDKIYSSSGNSFIVHGGMLTQQVAFVPVKYEVTFKESGIPSGIAWYINITGFNGDFTASSFLQLNLTNGTYSYSVATPDKIYTAVGGTFTISGTQVAVSVEFTTVRYNVTFLENGIPSGTPWYVNFSNGEHYSSDSAELTLSLVNGSYTYSVSTSDKSFAPGNTSGSIVMDGEASAVNVKFIPVYYSVKFTESGLPSGTTWYVNITGGQSYSSSTPVIDAELTNGTYHYSIGTTDRKYSSSGGSFTVGGSAMQVTIGLSQVKYNVKFTETGIPAGSKWTLVFDGNTSLVSSTQELFSVVNGTYGYRAYFNGNYSALPSYGNATVSGSNITINIVFSEVSSELNFTESGVPSGVAWHLEFNGRIFSTDGKSIIVKSNPGTYSYSANYTLFGQNVVVHGNLTLSRSAEKVSVQFPALYRVTFHESGLHHDAQWWVTLGGSNITGHENSFNVMLPNGTYNFTIHDSSGQTFQVTINYGEGNGRDYTVATSVSGTNDHRDLGSQPLMVEGHNVYVHVHFNEGDSGHHWGWKEYLTHGVNAVIGYIVYTTHIVQYAATYAFVSIRFMVVFSAPVLTSAMFPFL